ncbi:MAG: hypothetical protein HC821_02260 [Lewinella sp.]|nr:hypothetical protein [Lewinella sp.]
MGLLTFTSFANQPQYETQSFELNFFADQLKIDFAPDMKLPEPAELNNQVIDRMYRQLQAGPLDVLLASLLALKAHYGLNDYLFFKLAKNSLAAIYGGGSYQAREISLFALLANAGFDVRLTFRTNQAYVNVFTQEELFEVPMIDHEGRAYANLSCLNGECAGRQSLFIYRLQPNPRGRSFGFQLKQWPTLAARPIKKNLEFQFRGLKLNINLAYDLTTVEIMKDYPFINEYCYLDTPLSPTLAASLLPNLRTLLAPLSLREQLELLVSFTRSAFEYKEDSEYFGRSKPMVPEELFSYAYSDCEDRAALFFALVKELLQQPMTVLAYDDHLTVAVASNDIPGDHFTYQGRRYIFCDPTGPRNSSQIAEVPTGYAGKNFEIIGQYE